jgi:hypothetical protein
MCGGSQHRIAIHLRWSMVRNAGAVWEEAPACWRSFGSLGAAGRCLKVLPLAPRPRVDTIADRRLLGGELILMNSPVPATLEA